MQYLIPQHKLPSIVALLALGSTSALAETRAHWEFQAGLSGRRIGSTTFSSDISALPTGGQPFVSSGPTLPAGVGSDTVYSDHAYDDGFVNISDPATSISGLTSNWGYNDASQVQNDTLVFTATGGTYSEATSDTTQSASTGYNSGSETDIAPYIELSRYWHREDNPGTEVGVILNFSWMKNQASSPLRAFSQTDYTLTNYDITVVDTYDLNGVVPPIALPYDGSVVPNGPLIGNIPSNRQIMQSPGSIETASDINELREHLDFDMQTLSLGVAIRKIRNAQDEAQDGEPGGRARQLSGQLEGGITLNRYDLEWNQQQSVSRTVNSTTTTTLIEQQDRDIGLKFGAYAAASANLGLNEKGTRYLSLTSRYDWAGNESVGNESGSAEIDLSGWSIALGIGFLF